MSEAIGLRKIQRYTNAQIVSMEDNIISEYTFTVKVNGYFIVTLLCSPIALEELALGFLESEGILHAKNEISSLDFNEEIKVINITADVDDTILAQSLLKKPVYTSGCGKGFTFQVTIEHHSTSDEGKIKMTPKEIIRAADLLQSQSNLFERTGAAHISLLLLNKEVVSCHEDIGRHNTVDKVFGECLLRKIPCQESVFVTSGRLTGEMVQKCSLRKVPVIISRSAATSQAIDSAEIAGITLIGFVRGQGFNVYSHSERIAFPD